MTQEAITSYDAMGREVSSTDQNTGEVTTTTYDFMGRVVKTERSLTDQEGNKTSQMNNLGLIEPSVRHG